MVKHIRLKLLGAMIIVGGLMVLPAKAEFRAASNATVNVTSSCSMSATGTNTHNATIINGRAAENIGTTVMTVNCNDENGFSLYAVGYTNAVVGNTALVGANTGLAINTGEGTTGNVSNWGMKVMAAAGDYAATLDDGYDIAGYNIVPEIYDRVAYRTAATGANNNEAATITATYRAYVSPIQAADSYSGKVRYVLVHPTSAVASGGFDAAFANAGKIKYADTGYYAMQDMTSAICNSVVDYGAETQLVDTRDNKLYWVLKADDGKCWMTQNLDLDLRTDTTAADFVALTSENTDLNVYDDVYISGYTYEDGVITWTPAMATYHNDPSFSTPNNSIKNDNTDTAPRSWNLTVNNSEIYQKDGSIFFSVACNYFTTPSCIGSDKYFNTEPFAANGEHGKLGNYYNWSAAVASNDTSSRIGGTYNNTAENPKNSICPKGWRLTRSAATVSYNDFQNLYSYYNAIGKANGSPLWLVRAGYVSNGTLNFSVYIGYYWSSTVGGSHYAYRLYVDSNSFGPSDEYRRYYGQSVRCVAR